MTAPDVAVAHRPADPSKDSGWRQRVATVLGPTILTWALCAYGLGSSQFRGDELCTWWAATLPEESFRRLVGHVDAVLAPYYLAMRWWIRGFGDSEAAMRAPSAMAMGVCAGLVASLGTRLVGRRVGLRAGLVFALLPIVSRYGQEARPYALAAMFATLSSLLLLRLLERPGPFARAACYAAALTGLGLTHLLALLVLPAHLACCVRFTRDRPFLVIDRRTFPRVALAAGVGVGFVLLLVFAGARQRSAQIGRGGSLPELVGLASRSISHATLGALVLGAIVVVLALRQAFASRQPILLRLWAVLPPVVLLSTYPVLHLWAMRYVVFTLPAIVLLVANAIEPLTARIREPAWATAVTVALVGVLGARMHVAARSSLARSSGDYRAMGAELRRLAEPDDAVAFGGSEVIPRIPRLALAYELRRGPRLGDVFVSRPMSELGSFVPMECVDPRPCLPRSVRRLWLLTSAPPSDLFEGMPASRAELLRREFTVAEIHPHWHANLALLAREAPPAHTD